MRKVIVTNVLFPYDHLKGQIGNLETHAGGIFKLYKISFSDQVSHYLYRNEFEYVDEYLLKYWLED